MIPKGSADFVFLQGFVAPLMQLPSPSVHDDCGVKVSGLQGTGSCHVRGLGEVGHEECSVSQFRAFVVFGIQSLWALGDR
eukprot:2442376-Pyramimonas_sp.AAC.1